MSDPLAAFRANPGLLAVTALLVAGAAVLGIIGVSMARSGASLRPLIFFGGFFGIVVLPQVAFHLAQAMEWIPRRDLTWRSASPSAPGPRLRLERLHTLDGRFTEAPTAVAADADPQLVTDLRTAMPDGPFTAALAAHMLVVRPNGSLVMARFPTADAARAATDAYLRLMTGAVPPPQSDGTWLVARHADVVKLVLHDDALVAWSAPDTASVERAVRESPLVAPPAAASTPDAPAAPRRDFWLYRPLTLTLLALGLLVVATAWFLRMSTWAAEVPALAGAPRVPATTLRERILALNALGVPFRVTPLADDPSRLEVTWRYADATWVDTARVRGLRRTHRILLRVDEASGVVRSVEQSARLDWSAGRGGAGLTWTTERGIIFFQRERQRVYGLVLDAQGRLTPDLAYEYRFDLQEMKAPLITAVTAAGWGWRPTLVVVGPRWLHWLTGA